MTAVLLPGPNIRMHAEGRATPTATHQLASAQRTSLTADIQLASATAPQRATRRRQLALAPAHLTRMTAHAPIRTITVRRLTATATTAVLLPGPNIQMRAEDRATPTEPPQTAAARGTTLSATFTTGTATAHQFQATGRRRAPARAQLTDRTARAQIRIAIVRRLTATATIAVLLGLRTHSRAGGRATTTVPHQTAPAQRITLIVLLRTVTATRPQFPCLGLRGPGARNVLARAHRMRDTALARTRTSTVPGAMATATRAAPCLRQTTRTYVEVLVTHMGLRPLCHLSLSCHRARPEYAM